MKIPILTLAALFVGTWAFGASINLTYGISNGGNDLYTLSLVYDPGEVIDIFDIELIPDPPSSFINTENVAPVVNFVPGSDDTDILGTGTLAIGVTTLLGTVDDDDRFSSSIGGPAGTPLTDLMPSGTAFLQVVLPPGGRFRGSGRFVAGGQVIGGT